MSAAGVFKKRRDLLLDCSISLAKQCLCSQAEAKGKLQGWSVTNQIFAEALKRFLPKGKAKFWPP